MRRLFLLLGLAALGCVGSVPSPSTRAAPVPDEKPPADIGTRKFGDDWPRFLGPLGTSVSSEKGMITPWPAEGPRIVWQKEVGVGYGMPSISRGRLFLFDRHKNHNRLSCLKSGNRRTALDNSSIPPITSISSATTAARAAARSSTDDRVYIYGPEGMLHCVRVSDGKMIWKVDTIADFGVIQNFFGVGSTPVIEGDLLIVQVGGSPKGSEDVSFSRLKGNDSGVVAFDKMTGKVKWQVGDELASYSSPVLATIDKRRWCFVFARGGLIGLDPATGKVDFHFPWRARILESVNASNPVVVGNRCSSRRPTVPAVPCSR